MFSHKKQYIVSTFPTLPPFHTLSTFIRNPGQATLVVFISFSNTLCIQQLPSPCHIPHCRQTPYLVSLEYHTEYRLHDYTITYFFVIVFCHNIINIILLYYEFRTDLMPSFHTKVYHYTFLCNPVIGNPVSIQILHLF